MTDLKASVNLPRLLGFLAALLLLVGSFYVGMSVGIHKTQRVMDWCEGYGHLFDRHPSSGSPLLGGPPAGLPGDHGAFGTVLSVSGDTVVISSQDNLEQTVQVTSSTTIRIGHQTGSLTDLQPKDQIAVFGEPGSDGRIGARLIRIFNTQVNASSTRP